jgi:hypothetical protein
MGGARWRMGGAWVARCDTPNTRILKGKTSAWVADVALLSKTIFYVGRKDVYRNNIRELPATPATYLRVLPANETFLHFPIRHPIRHPFLVSRSFALGASLSTECRLPSPTSDMLQRTPFPHGGKAREGKVAA